MDTDTANDARPILVMGATSGIGALAVSRALEGGHAVRGFARSAEKMDPAPGLEPMAGDATKLGDLERALSGVRGVIYALGVKERPSMIWKEETLFSTTTGLLIEAMKRQSVSRLVAVTGFGAGRSRDAMSMVERMGHGAILGKVYEDKTRQEALIMESGLDWTIVRPVILTKGAASGNYKVLTDPSDWRNGLISRADVADYLVSAVVEGRDMAADVVLTR